MSKQLWNHYFRKVNSIIGVDEYLHISNGPMTVFVLNKRRENLMVPKIE